MQRFELRTTKLLVFLILVWPLVSIACEIPHAKGKPQAVQFFLQPFQASKIFINGKQVRYKILLADKTFAKLEVNAATNPYDLTIQHQGYQSFEYIGKC